MLNKIVLQGRLTDNLELRHTQSNTAVASGTIAVQRSRKDNNGEYQSDFCSVVLWGKLASTQAHGSTRAICALFPAVWKAVTGRTRTAISAALGKCSAKASTSAAAKSEGKPQKQEESDFISTDEEFDELPF